MQLTENFTLEEMQCPCGECNGGTMDMGFMQKLQRMRDICGFPFPPESGYRCHEHNRDVGGAPDSGHLHGRAADITLTNYRMRAKFLDAAHLVKMTGIGLGKNFIHVDDYHPKPAVWTYAEKKKRNT